MGNLKLILKYFPVFIALMLYSCTDPSDDVAPIAVASRVPIKVCKAQCRVTSFSIINTYHDEFRNMAVGYNPDFTGRINLSYSNKRITQVHGGLRAYAPGGGFSGFFWRNDVTENIDYSGNAITVNNLGMYTKQFVILNDKIQSQYTTYTLSVPSSDIMNYSPGLHEYQYQDNTIIETKDGQTRRIFYLDNENLVKVELFFRDFNNTVYKKVEYLFSNFDENPNLLKGKFFLNGCFFKAFSRNNYGMIDINTYNFVNGAYELDPNEFGHFTFNNIFSDMFTQECN